jgi:hypothetical protein
MKRKLAFSRPDVVYVLAYLLWAFGVLVWKYGPFREIRQGVYPVSELWWKYSGFAILLTLWAFICWAITDRIVRRSTGSIVGAIAANGFLNLMGLLAIAIAWHPNSEFWLRENAIADAGRYFLAEFGILDFFILVPLLTLGSCLIMWLRCWRKPDM